LRLFSFGGYGLALAALALVVFGAYNSYPILPREKGFPYDFKEIWKSKRILYSVNQIFKKEKCTTREFTQFS